LATHPLPHTWAAVARGSWALPGAYGSMGSWARVPPCGRGWLASFQCWAATYATLSHEELGCRCFGFRRTRGIGESTGLAVSITSSGVFALELIRVFLRITLHRGSAGGINYSREELHYIRGPSRELINKTIATGFPSPPSPPHPIPARPPTPSSIRKRSQKMIRGPI